MDKLLIVDDDRTLRHILGVTFRYSDFKLLYAENGTQALEIAARELPSVFILDILMPGMDGFEVCRHIRGNPALVDSVIVMLTSLTDEDDLKSGIQAGADHYMTKPFHSIELVETVERLHAMRLQSLKPE